MASGWRSLLKEKILSVLSRDKEIKEQFIGRWQLTRDRLEQKVPNARCTIKRQGNKGAISWKMRVESVTCRCMWSNMLIDRSPSIEFCGINFSLVIVIQLIRHCISLLWHQLRISLFFFFHYSQPGTYYYNKQWKKLCY